MINDTVLDYFIKCLENCDFFSNPNFISGLHAWKTKIKITREERFVKVNDLKPTLVELF